MVRLDPDHPAIRNLAAAICEVISAYIELSGREKPGASTEATDLDLPRLLTVTEAAKVLNLPYARVSGLVRGGGIHSISFGRTYRIPREALGEWIRRESEPKAEQPVRFRVGPSSRPQVLRPTTPKTAKQTPTTMMPASLPENDKPRLLNAKELAKRLKVGINYARNLMKTGQIYSLKIGNRHACTEEHVDEYIRHGGSPPAEGWEAYLFKKSFARMTPEGQRELIEDGFDPATGTFKIPD